MAQPPRASAVEGSSLLLKKLNALCHISVLEKQGHHGLGFQDYINQQRSERSHDQALFAGFTGELEEAILHKAGSEKINDKMGAAVAVEDILTVQLAGDDPAKFDVLFNRIKLILDTVEDVSSAGLDAAQKLDYQQKLLKFTTKVYGLLVKTAGAGFTSVVEELAKRQISSLSNTSDSDLKRFTAVLLLTEMARNCASVFIALLPKFLSHIFSTLTHKQLYIRDASAAAAQAAFRESSIRCTRFRIPDHYILLEQVLIRVKPNAPISGIPVEVLHGSLLAFRELLAVSGIMLSRYATTVELVCRMKDHKDILIRRSVVMLFPLLADFAPHFFARNQLPRCFEHLTTILKSVSERGLVFSAIGDMFLALEHSLPVAGAFEAPLQLVVNNYLKVTLDSVMQQRKAQRQQGHPVQPNPLHCNETLQCIGKLSKALKGKFKVHAHNLIEHMVLTGLSRPLYDALKMVADNITELKALVQSQLMDLVQWVLARKPFHAHAQHHGLMTSSKFPQAFQGETIEPATRALALEIVCDYLYQDINLVDFLVDTVQPLIDHKDPEVKQQAVRCTLYIIAANFRSMGRSTGRMNPSQVERTMDRVLHKVLGAAMADPNPEVRRKVVEVIYKCKPLEPRLAMFDCIELLLLMLEDDKGEPRLLVKLLVNIAKINPYNIREQLVAYMKEKLRHILYHPETEVREKSAVLLDSMLGAAVDITHDYVEPVQKILVKQLIDMDRMSQQHQDSYDTAPPSRQSLHPHMFENAAATSLGVAPVVTERMMECLLRSLGNVARVSGTRFGPYVKRTVELVVKQIEGNGGAEKRAAAVTALGQILNSCGGVVDPYIQFPNLMGHLLRMMHEGRHEHKVAAMRTVGVIGALDPHTHKLNLASIAGEGKLEKEGVRPVGNTRPAERTLGGTLVAAHLAPAHEDADLLPCAGMATNNEDYYPTIAINALMRVLRDRSCASLHAKAVSAVMEIFMSLNSQAVPFLDKVMPVLFKMMQKNDEAFRKMLLEKLRLLVKFMRQHLSKFMKEMMRLTLEHFGDSLEIREQCLLLLAETSLLLRESMRQYMPGFMVKFMETLNQIQESGNLKLLWPFLQMLVNLAHLNEIYLPELYTYIIRLAEPESTVAEEEKILIIEELKKVLPRTALTKFAPTALYPLHIILESPKASYALRVAVLDAMCIIGTKLYHNWGKFVPNTRAAFQRVKEVYGVQHEWMERLLTLQANLRPPPTTYYTSWVKSDTWSDELDKVDQWVKAQARVPPYNPEREAHQVAVSVPKLIKAFLVINVQTAEDWLQWLRKASLELLSQSTSPALRVCQPLAAVHPTVAKELFAVGFVSCWQTMNLDDKARLKRELALIVRKPRIPSEVSSTLLNLAEYMELDEKEVPLSRKSLGHVAKRCSAYAKALHHTEEVFTKMLSWTDERHTAAERSKMLSTTVEELIEINNRLGQVEAAKGVLTHAKKDLPEFTSLPSHYERLQRWDEAMKEYHQQLRDLSETYRGGEPTPLQRKAYLKAMAGLVRCMFNMMDFKRSLEMCKRILKECPLKPEERAVYAEVKALTEWHLGKDADFAQSLLMLKPMYNTSILEAIHLLKQEQFKKTLKKLDQARDSLAHIIATPLSESYDRAYHFIFKMQWIAQVEESVDYLKAKKMISSGLGSEEHAEKMHYIRKMWDWRLECVERSVDKWQAQLSLREMVIDPQEDEEVWIKFAKLCSKNGRVKRGREILTGLLGFDPASKGPEDAGYGMGTKRPHVMLAWLEHCWHVAKEGEREKLVPRLESLVEDVGGQPLEIPQRQLRRELNMAPGPSITPVHFEEREKPIIQARVNKRLAHWLLHLNTGKFNAHSIEEIKHYIHTATNLSHGWAKAWHLLARFHTAVMLQFEKEKRYKEVEEHVPPAIIGYFNALQSARHIGDSPNNQQDLLRLLTLWFKYGHLDKVVEALTDGFDQICANLWLHVVPQVIARIHHPDSRTRDLIIILLIKVGHEHPQALMFPLLVARASKVQRRIQAATKVLDALRTCYPQLVREAETVAHELNRIAVLWHEKWHERLEEASRLYFGEQDVRRMLQELLPLHQELEKPDAATTMHEKMFLDNYGDELRDAHHWLKTYQQTNRDPDLQQAWDLYYHAFRKINKAQGSLTSLDLQNVSPQLQKLSSLELAVPGTYIPGDPMVLIMSFTQQLQVLPSKQRPRRLIIVGQDGQQYQFLLKGHEDLRQDERVMQLFGLVNNLMSHDRTTADKDLSIGRFAVVPLHPQSGLIGWLLNTDTLHVLIKEYREAHKIQLNLEHRRMLSFAPDLDTLTVMQKIEVFLHAQDTTEKGNQGDDLHKVLWLKSRSSEVWIDRRTAFVRSTAVMSMVGFLLGLGDRHPSNILLDRYSGKLLHIDFGDCFETAMKRDKFPEKVPFRLTRMMVRAMGPMGVEGNFRLTCEAVMGLLRREADSLLAMLETFVHDPLLNWRLGNQVVDTAHALTKNTSQAVAAAGGLPPLGGEGVVEVARDPSNIDVIPSESELNAVPQRHNAVPPEMRGEEVSGAELSQFALQAMQRVQAKLRGVSVDPDVVTQKEDYAPEQVKELIKQATSVERLCQLYVGWCAFW